MLVFVFPSRRRHTRCALVNGVQTCALPIYFIDDSPYPGWEPSLTARNGGAILASALRTLRQVGVTLNGTGTLSVSQWENWTDGTAELSGATYDFTDRKSVA